ncbi:MAG: type transport system permease protein [Bacillota bacterium]|jgi:ABC-2 type transport system permease protein|nr:type transport system permease protein [Bacillota bacterium]MDK2925632.1 type transport system permease protein [Bacillota bacterium]
MLRGFFTAIRTEWQMAVREKMILVILFLIPVLVNLMLGYELYQNQIKNIPMAVVDMDNSSLSRTIVRQFSENETFAVRYYLDNVSEMERLFQENKIRVAMVIPPAFAKDVVALKSPTILMVYDGSQLAVAAAAKSRASEILLTLKTGVLLKQIQARLDVPEDMAKKMALAVNFNYRTLYNPTRGYKNFLNIGLCAALVQSGIGLLSVSAIRDFELTRSKLQRIGHVLGKVAFYGGLGCLSLFLSAIMQNWLFQVPFRGRLGDELLLAAALSFAVAGLGVMISSWLREPLIATIVAAVLLVPDTVLAGYTWPRLAMPGAYQKAVAFLPFTHFADNQRDLMLKGLTAAYMRQDLIWLAIFTAAMIILAILGTLRLKTGLGEEKARESEAAANEVS